ncbi:hypothetical protein KKH23_05450 [Patescibacteria group bacterium]|uniref:Uncharacterized protein n=1 Tax=viral metagenome TaxID=1070528 RepID=A0A6M3LUJ9_9ZZZZ|nr:hypothetical protein [Patescibacteria group bacterium]
MGAEFDKETITIEKGQNVIDALNRALEKKGLADRMDSDYGLFILHDVTVISIEGDNVVCLIEYEYGG